MTVPSGRGRSSPPTWTETGGRKQRPRATAARAPAGQVSDDAMVEDRGHTPTTVFSGLFPISAAGFEKVLLGGTPPDGRGHHRTDARFFRTLKRGSSARQTSKTQLNLPKLEFVSGEKRRRGLFFVGDQQNLLTDPCRSRERHFCKNSVPTLGISIGLLIPCHFSAPMCDVR